MNRLPLAALAVLACLLAVVLLAETRGRERAAVLPAAVPTHEPGPAPGVPIHGGVSAALLESWVGAVLERPIFSPSRRPGTVALAASTELPRLAGIIVGPGGARAIFASSGDTRAIVAGAGGRAGPYLIRAVGLSGVSVIGPNGAELLRPDYDRNGAHPVVGLPAEPGPPSILDLLRSRVQNGGGLNPSLLPPPTFQHPPNR